MMMFLIGSAATVAGVIISYRLLSPQDSGISQANGVAGIFTGTYFGGGVNLSAIALQYGVNKNGNLFTAVNAINNEITIV